MARHADLVGEFYTLTDKIKARVDQADSYEERLALYMLLGGLSELTAYAMRKFGGDLDADVPVRP